MVPRERSFKKIMKKTTALVCDSLSKDLSGLSLMELKLPDLLPKQILIQ